MFFEKVFKKRVRRKKDIIRLTDEQAKEAAEYFAAVIFGKEQAEKLTAFYADDPGCVISVCGQYFKNRLAGKIAAVQKKMKP